MNGLIEKISEWTFMIVDPFDKTYNTAKSMKKYSEFEEEFFNAMNDTLDSIISCGYFPMK